MADTEDMGADWLAEKLGEILVEDLEMELEDAALSREIARICKARHPDALDNKTYLTNLIHMQAERIKLQDWVQHTKEKVVVLFEGRDGAGKVG